MTAREKVEALAWCHAEPRSSYDAAILNLVTALVDEVEELRAQIRHIGYVQEGGEAC